MNSVSKEIKKKHLLRRNIYIYFLLLLFFPNLIFREVYPKSGNIKNLHNLYFQNYKNSKDFKIIDLLANNWIKLDNKFKDKNSIRWEKLQIDDPNYFIDSIQSKTNNKNKKDNFSLESLNRSIVFNNDTIGPDISWLVPPGFKWTNKYKWDFSARGHNRRKKNQSFLGWNGGDAVGQFYYHPLNLKNRSYGINLGIRSLYSGSQFIGGSTSVGEGLSLGFRTDKRISNSSGMAFGAEQLLHFDGLTDTGRDIYFTISKGIWSNKVPGNFPLTIGTFGVGTGKMAEGNIKFLCSDLFGGSGTEVAHQRRLCWSPIFSLARVYNSQFSTFFEYNSKWFLLGTSIVPLKSKPIRGTFALQISDHIDNYKVNSFDQLKWVFRLSVGF